MAFPLIPVLSGLSGLGSIAQLFGRQDPSKQYQQYFQQLQGLFSPSSIGNRSNEFYQQFLRSPAYANSQRALQGGSNAFQGAYARRLGGVGAQTGVGNVGAGLAAANYGGNISQLHAQGYQGALQQALDSLRMQAGAAGGFPLNQPTNFQGNLAGGMGGLNQWLLLQSLFGKPK